MSTTPPRGELFFCQQAPLSPFLQRVDVTVALMWLVHPRFALPALLPLITPELQLSDTQGSLLTAGYTVRPILLVHAQASAAQLGWREARVVPFRCSTLWPSSRQACWQTRQTGHACLLAASAFGAS